ncbi:hypothetical protein B0T18DRAFT_394802 [Schizothecium vesticola]|uniref:Uncharacterized protein n=1 Tax=Schizothecium vesticola TaxID=314040 RepID=A0AA40EHN3_9PEZI|nr:hypothetical protein B0T18DRAFT_394802 [Schizothecium vesticola]
MAGLPDRSGQGIELSSRQSEDPGLHVYTPSTATTATPGGFYPHPEDNKNLPWEKSSYTHQQPHNPHFYDHRPLIPPPPDNPLPPFPPGTETNPEPRILGLKRRLFFILLAALVVVLVIGIATGVGVGVAVNGKDSPKTTPTPTTTPSPTRLFPAPLATATTSPNDLIQCPSANLTLYASRADLAKRFLVLCGRDYHSSEGTLDILSRDAETMAQCIDYCATTRDKVRDLLQLGSHPVEVHIWATSTMSRG